jgi:hypothetical protein
MAVPYIESWGGRNAIVLGNSQLIRKVNLPVSWSSVRIGVLVGFTSGSYPRTFYTMTGTPAFYVGLCSGSKGILDVDKGHCIGVTYTDGFPTTHSTALGGPEQLNTQIAYGYTAVTNSAITLTTDMMSAGGGIFIAQTGSGTTWGPTAHYVRITKGSPNFTQGLYYQLVGPYAAGTGDCPYKSFLRELASNDPIFYARDSGSLVTTEILRNTLPTDEAANGSFDSINIAWTRERPEKELLVYAIGVTVLA